MPSTRFNPLFPTLDAVDGTAIIGETDIVKKNKKTIGQFISDLSKGKQIVVSNTVLEVNTEAATHAAKFPIAAPGESQETFQKLISENGGELQNYSESDTFQDVSQFLDKGDLGSGNTSSTRSGHQLLASDSASFPLSEAIEQISNTFDSQNIQEIDTRISYENINTSPATRRKINMPGEGVPVIEKQRAFRASDTRLIALSMLGAATGKIGEDWREDIKKFESGDKFGAAAGSKLSFAQVGTKKIPVSDLTPGGTKIITDLNRTTRGIVEPAFEFDDGMGETIVQNGSFGSLNSPFEPWGATFSNSTSFIVAAGATYALILSTAAFIGTFTKTVLAPNAQIQTVSMEMGKWRYKKEQTLKGIITDALVEQFETPYQPTNFLGQSQIFKTGTGRNYFECVIAGWASFCGLDFDPLTQGSFEIGALATLKLGTLAISPVERGFYMNIFRVVLRETKNLKEDIAAASQLGGSDPFAGFSGLFAVKFIDTLAKIGDQIFSNLAANVRFGQNILQPDVLTLRKDIQNEFYNINLLGSAIRRISGDKVNGVRNTNWSLSFLPNLSLVPTGSNQIYRKLFETDFQKTILQDYKGKNKFSEEQVAYVESVLDAEYMPFYFQDLRTNEIVSFHAFIEDLSDSFAASYSQSPGFGRVEDVQIYQKTKRSVSVTFHIVSTNQEDFDFMWMCINKLTTLVYPQWSGGERLRTTLDGNTIDFTQPFSQIMTASPLMRIRIGDLIRSNYSRFNLKRLFGYQNVEMNQGSVSGTALQKFYDENQNAVIRSFESGMGLGLAAFVTQLSFTWMDGLWGVGEDGPGNRAPRNCKVQMSLEPIHDIPPGIDSDGFNRAPIYPVGQISGKLSEGQEENPFGRSQRQRNNIFEDQKISKDTYETANMSADLDILKSVKSIL